MPLSDFPDSKEDGHGYEDHDVLSAVRTWQDVKGRSTHAMDDADTRKIASWEEVHTCLDYESSTKASIAISAPNAIY